VVRDADPPYQQVFRPCRVPLEATDLPAEAGESRDKILQKLLYSKNFLRHADINGTGSTCP